MSCKHPQKLIRRVVREDGVEGIRCQSCGAIAFAGESWWTAFKRDVVYMFGGRDENIRYSDAVE